MTIRLFWFASEGRAAALRVQTRPTPKRTGGLDVLPDRVLRSCSARSCLSRLRSVASGWVVDSTSCTSCISGIGATSAASFSVGGAIKCVASGMVNVGAAGFSGT